MVNAHMTEATTSIQVPLTITLMTPPSVAAHDETDEQQKVAEPVRRLSAGDVAFDALAHLHQRAGHIAQRNRHLAVLDERRVQGANTEDHQHDRREIEEVLFPSLDR